MLKFYIKTALRNFQTNKVIFVGSLLTLCLGALCISLLFSYVHNELTMDDFHKREKDIYMVMMKQSPKSDWHHPFKFDASKYPEIETYTSIISFQEEELKFTYEKNTYTPQGIVGDSTFFKVFDFELKIGDKSNILNDFQSLILTEEFSEKIFGKENPIGRQIIVKGRMGEDIHTVKGILEMPANSSIKFDYILPNNYDRAKYSRGSVHIILTKKNFVEDEFNNKIETINNNVPNLFPQLTESITKIISFKDIYFNKDLSTLKSRSFFKTGNRKNIDILIMIMLVILLVSILNFSNLQIINTNAIMKAIAISKVNGAHVRHIISQKIIENIVLVFLSTILITVIFNIVISHFNTFVNVALAPPIWRIFLLNAVILLFLSGIGLIYPFYISSRVSLVKGLKSKLYLESKLKGKKVIVVLQYALTFVLVISSIVVANQLDLMLSKDLGFKSDNIIKAKLYYAPPYNPATRTWSKEKREEEMKKRLEKPQYINNQLSSFSSIEKFAQGMSPLEVFQIDWKPNEDTFQYESINTLVGTANYTDIFKLEILSGRFFEEGLDEQRSNKIIINEAAMKYWRISDINTARIKNRSWTKPGGKGFEIIGVVKDFNYEHLAVKPKPLIMLYWDDIDSEYFLKFEKNKTNEGILNVQSIFNEINPNQTFKYSFISHEIAALYQKEKRLSTIYILFTIIALLISAIGLFTIALYDTQRRTKEIGVRKVNGATIKEVMLMLNKDFVKWVGLAFVIACPVAYYAMSKWLENFAYKTSLSWWVFALAGVFTLVIALLTVSWQSYTAATRNPVEALKDE